jgi:CubicO group peptidase (beta-lactamase class C family)
MLRECFVLMALTVLTVRAMSALEPDREQIDSLFRKAGVIYQGEFGARMTSDSIFRIGSMTEAVTSEAAIHQGTAFGRFQQGDR